MTILSITIVGICAAIFFAYKEILDEFKEMNSTLGDIKSVLESIQLDLQINSNDRNIPDV